MELLIDIPEEVYRYAKKYNVSSMLALREMGICMNAIANGTPIPKGHRVIDADEILNHAFIREDEEGDIFVQKYYCVEKEIVDNALIEADKE